jgi:hypothetical protein
VGMVIAVTATAARLAVAVAEAEDGAGFWVRVLRRWGATGHRMGQTCTRWHMFEGVTMATGPPGPVHVHLACTRK